MNQQQVNDRLGHLNAEVANAQKQAAARERMKQNAERLQLMAECAAIGHVMVHMNYSMLFGRSCAACGLAEDASASAVANNLNTVSSLPP